MALLNPAFVPEPRAARTPAQLRLVPNPRERVTPLTFSVVLVSLLIAGLLSLLVLNTMLTANSFALHSLQQQARTLSDQEQALTERLVRTESPESLAARAGALGMIPSGTTTFLTMDGLGQR